MAPGGTNARTSPVVSDERLRNAMRLQLDRIINIERSKTRSQLASETGVNISQIDAILHSDPGKKRRLKSEDMFSLLWGMDEQAVNAVLAIMAYGGAERLTNPSSAGDMERVADAICEVGIVAGAVARGNGRVRHGDDKTVRQAADKAIRDMLPFSSFGGGE